jgi:hypothetical protein
MSTMPSAANLPKPLSRGIKCCAAWPEFIAHLRAMPVASDNQPQYRSGFQALDRVIIRREIRLGETHILPGAAGIITTVRNKGRLLDVQFAGTSITLHHLDLSPAPGSPAARQNAQMATLPGGRPLLARPDNAVHPHHLLGRKAQLRVGRV